MNELLEISYILGRQRIDDLHREADRQRLSSALSKPDRQLRQRIGRFLVRAGLLLIGPQPARPAGGH